MKLFTLPITCPLKKLHVVIIFYSTMYTCSRLGPPQTDQLVKMTSYYLTHICATLITTGPNLKNQLAMLSPETSSKYLWNSKHISLGLLMLLERKWRRENICTARLVLTLNTQNAWSKYCNLKNQNYKANRWGNSTLPPKAFFCGEKLIWGLVHKVDKFLPKVSYAYFSFVCTSFHQ